MILKLIMFLCHLKYKKYKMPILYIKGTGKDYPKYLVYTEDENIYKTLEVL